MRRLRARRLLLLSERCVPARVSPLARPDSHRRTLVRSLNSEPSLHEKYMPAVDECRYCKMNSFFWLSVELLRLWGRRPGQIYLYYN